MTAVIAFLKTFAWQAVALAVAVLGLQMLAQRSYESGYAAHKAEVAEQYADKLTTGIAQARESDTRLITTLQAENKRQLSIKQQLQKRLADQAALPLKDFTDANRPLIGQCVVADADVRLLNAARAAAVAPRAAGRSDAAGQAASAAARTDPGQAGDRL